MRNRDSTRRRSAAGTANTVVPTERVRYPLFDSIRVAAAIVVIVSHSFALLGRREPHPFSFAHVPMTLGSAAVGVFFIVSGFLITASWTANRSLWAFSIKRVFRIWPALIVAVVAAAYLLGPIVTTLPSAAYHSAPGTSAYVRQNITMNPINNTLPGVFTNLPVPAVNGSLWTLPYEVLCYLGVAVAGLLGLLKRRWIVAGLALASLIWCQVVFNSPQGWWTPVPHSGLMALSVVQLVPWFCVGAALGSWHTAIPRGRLPLVVGALALALGTALSSPLLIIPGVGILIIDLGTRPSSWHLPTWAGDPSYGMYIFAFPIAQCLIYSGLGTDHVVVLMAETALITFVVGVISWHLVERPAVALGGRLARAPRSARTWWANRAPRPAAPVPGAPAFEHSPSGRPNPAATAVLPASLSTEVTPPVPQSTATT